MIALSKIVSSCYTDGAIAYGFLRVAAIPPKGGECCDDDISYVSANDCIWRTDCINRQRVAEGKLR